MPFIYLGITLVCFGPNAIKQNLGPSPVFASYPAFIELSEKHMRYLFTLAFCFLLVSLQAHACLGFSLENKLFFETIPNPPPHADVIAKVSLSNVNGGTATAKVMQLLKTSDTRVHQGDKIAMKFEFTSCGPNHRNGDEGTILAKTGTDSEGRLVLYPYMRRYSDGQITPPSM